MSNFKRLQSRIVNFITTIINDRRERKERRKASTKAIIQLMTEELHRLQSLIIEYEEAKETNPKKAERLQIELQLEIFLFRTSLSAFELTLY